MRDRIARHDERIGTIADALGWFSLALGAVELTAPGALDRWLGVGHRETVTRLYGLREIAAGAGLLAARNPAPWLWARVAGDIVDLASLYPALDRRNPQRRVAVGAAANVALITALDVAAALAASRRRY